MASAALHRRGKRSTGGVRFPAATRLFTAVFLQMLPARSVYAEKTFGCSEAPKISAPGMGSRALEYCGGTAVPRNECRGFSFVVRDACPEQTGFEGTCEGWTGALPRIMTSPPLLRPIASLGKGRSRPSARWEGFAMLSLGSRLAAPKGRLPRRRTFRAVGLGDAAGPPAWPGSAARRKNLEERVGCY